MRKKALITGGTKGIGKAVAICLAKADYDLILTYSSDVEIAEQTLNEIHLQFNVGVDLLSADITKAESIDSIHAFLSEKSISLDVLILNAGLTCRDSFEKMAMSDWENVFFANVHYPVFLIQKILSSINQGASIVFTGSLMAIEPHSVSLAYGVSKSAVHSLVKNLVKFLIPYNIRVNAVAPGFVDTEWQKNKPVEIRCNIESKVSLNRFCSPEELAEVYQLLIENNYLNGEIIVVDGGYSYK